MRLLAIRRFGSLFTVMGTILLVCTGIVLAQSTEAESTTSGPQMSAEKKAAEEDTASTSEDISSLSAGDSIPGRYIVVLKDDARGESRASSAQENAAQVAREVASDMAQEHALEAKRTYGNALKGFSAEIPQERVDDVRSDPRVEFVSEDRVVKAFAQTTPTGIRRTEAVSSSTAKINGVDERVDADIAILDTGIYPHPDLNRVGGVDCSNDGYSNYYSDGNGHGTHVAGTAAAKDDTGGVVGVAPGARLWAVKVLRDTGSGSWSDVICGIDWVTASAGTIDVVNMSLGGWLDKEDDPDAGDDGNCGNTNSDALHQAICGSVAAGVTYAVAAGNDDWEIYDGRWTAVPAAYDEVLAVTAVADGDGKPGGLKDPNCRSDDDDTNADFSNFATVDDDNHTIAAPGVCITSTWKPVRQAYKKRVKRGKRWVRVTRYRWVTGYQTISGTSMASPHVAGIAALCIKSGACSDTDGDGKVTPTEVAAKLRSDAQTKDSDPLNAYGFRQDPNSSPVSGRYYGYLTYPAGY